MRLPRRYPGQQDVRERVVAECRHGRASDRPGYLAAWLPISKNVAGTPAARRMAAIRFVQLG